LDSQAVAIVVMSDRFLRGAAMLRLRLLLL